MTIIVILSSPPYHQDFDLEVRSELVPLLGEVVQRGSENPHLYNHHRDNDDDEEDNHYFDQDNTDFDNCELL